MRTLEEVRADIDRVDREIVALYERRMALTDEVGRIKLERGIPVLDAGREEQVLLSRAALLADPARGEGLKRLYRLLMTLSRESQSKLIREAQHD